MGRGSEVILENKIDKMMKYYDTPVHTTQHALEEQHVRIPEPNFPSWGIKNSTSSAHPYILIKSQGCGLSCAIFFSGLFLLLYSSRCRSKGSALVLQDSSESELQFPAWG